MNNILSVNNLNKSFFLESGILKTHSAKIDALKDVSFQAKKGTILGVVGESGSGKTTLGKIICRLILPDTGNVEINGKNINELSRLELSNRVQMIFQDPFASLNPKLSISTILREACDEKSSKDVDAAVENVLLKVGLSPNIIFDYPHQFSGGQRQRIALARALLKKPSIILADEPLSSLDVSIQNQMIGLFLKLKEETDITFLFISHDILTTVSISDELLVMKDGAIVETGKAREVASNPINSYTKSLIEAVPLIK